MKRKAYHKIDVINFKEILKKKYSNIEEKKTTKKMLIEQIQNINNLEILIKGLEINKKKEIEKINIREYGFKESDDVKIEFVQDVFEAETRINLRPICVYELEDKIELPCSFNNKGKFYLDLISDTFERFKIKAENIITETDDITHIELYAKKNIQMAQRIFYETRMNLSNVQKKGQRTDVFIAFVQNVFLINVILYLQNMFSSFYHEKKMTKRSLKSELYDFVGMNIFMEPAAEYGNATKIEEGKKNINIKWNGQVNQLITVFYDFINEKMPNKKMLLEASVDDISELLNSCFVDKNGKPISKSTIDTCMKEYREDKRVKGKKRIDISKYALMDK